MPVATKPRRLVIVRREPHFTPVCLLDRLALNSHTASGCVDTLAVFSVAATFFKRQHLRAIPLCSCNFCYSSHGVRTLYRF